MRDEVMSYGKGVEAVSSLTLAAMEDLGYYKVSLELWGYLPRGLLTPLTTCRCRCTAYPVATCTTCTTYR